MRRLRLSFISSVVFILLVLTFTPPSSSAGRKKKEKDFKDIAKTVQKSITSNEISDHIKFLASNKLAGRATGSEGLRLAAEYIAKEFKAYGLKPGGKEYLQEFSTRRGKTWNVIGYLKGTTSDKVVIIGGHYDHIGMGRRARGKGRIHPGADDNASGAAAVMEIAEAFCEKGVPHDRTIVFIAIGAEEIGMLGSKHYCRQPTFPLSQTITMLNMDMISRNSVKKINIYGAHTSPKWAKIIKKANKYVKFQMNAPIRSRFFSMSDQASFYRAGVKVVLFFNCGMTRDFHKPTDTIKKCSFRKAEKVAELVCLLAYQVVNSKIDLAGGSGGSGESDIGGKLGIDATPADLDDDFRKKYKIRDGYTGILVEGIAEDSPAKKKVKVGDIIISVKGKKIPEGTPVMTFQEIVDTVKKGKKVKLILLRKKKKSSKVRWLKKNYRIKVP